MIKYIRLMIPVLLIALTVPAQLSAVEKNLYNEQRTFARAMVTEIEHVKEDENNPYDVMVKIHLKILEGPKKNESHIVEFKGDDNMPKGMFYQEGDTVFVGISKFMKSNDVDYISIYDVENTKGLIILGILLIISIIDSSRFWELSEYEPGRAQKSFDKQYLREWLETLDWDKTPPPPALPEEVISKTAAKYRDAYFLLTGKTLA